MADKKKKEELLTCMICLSKIVNAHMCPHCTKLSCQACIKDWLTDKKHQCPNCRVPLRINQLVNCARLTSEIQSAFQSQQDLHPVADEEGDLCAEHSNRLEYFCRTCQQPICADCAMFSASHKNHEFDKLNNVEKKHQDFVRAELTELEDYQNELQTQLHALERREKDLTRVRLQRLRDIQKQELSLVDRLTKHHQQRCLELLENKEKAAEQLMLVSSICAEYENRLESMPKSKLIAKGKGMAQFLNEFVTRELRKTNYLRPVLLSFNSDLIPQWKTSTFFINNFSRLRDNRQKSVIYTDSLIDRGLQWKLKVYPNGNEDGENKHLSIFVQMVKGVRPLAKYCYRIQLVNQKNALKFSRQYESQFSEGQSWGYNCFIKQSQLASEGYLLPQTDLLELKLSIRNSTFQQMAQDNSNYITTLESALERQQQSVQDLQREEITPSKMRRLGNEEGEMRKSIIALIKDEEEMIGHSESVCQGRQNSVVSEDIKSSHISLWQAEDEELPLREHSSRCSLNGSLQ